MFACNRKLLVSVFNAQEAHEAILGGGRIIDSEDPKSALGNISPRHIMDISDAVLDYRRDQEVQLSTNIGEDQLLFRRSQRGQAIEKSPYEIAGKAAQAAIGVSAAMGTRVHPVNYVKVGVDGMTVDQIGQVLTEVVQTLRRTDTSSHSQVMSVLFAQDLDTWRERSKLDAVRAVLVSLREFNPTAEDDPEGFDLADYAVGTLRDAVHQQVMFTDRSQVSLATLIRSGVLPKGSDGTKVRVNDLFEHRQFFPQLAAGINRTNQAVIKAMVDVTADSGAQAMMIDTSILSKVSNICLVDTRSHPDMVDINSLVAREGMTQRGILSLDDLRFFVEYAHYRGVAANVAGSIESYQAQQLWVQIPTLDQLSTRGSASAVDRDPSAVTREGADNRQFRVIKRSLVRGLAAPEHGGVLNLPESLKADSKAKEPVRELVARLGERRKALSFPDLETYYVNRYGVPTPFAF